MKREFFPLLLLACACSTVVSDDRCSADSGSGSACHDAQPIPAALQDIAPKSAGGLSADDGFLARGVPDPTGLLGFDPLSFDPPVTLTRDDVPDVVSAGEVVLVTGGNTRKLVTFNCTEEAPCGLKSDGHTRTQPIAVKGSHFVVDGFVFSGDETESIYALRGANHFVVRNIKHTGTGTRTRNGTSMQHSGGDVAVYLNNTINGIAVADGTDEVDYMGIGVASGSQIWIVGNEIERVGGDSLKLGQNVRRAGGVHPRNIYIVGNKFGKNGENPIDIKWATDIVISGNDLQGASVSVSSSGECTVIHESGDNVRFYDNVFRDCAVGIVTATSGGGASYIEVDGNTFKNVRLGIQNRGGGHAEITNNIFIDAARMWKNNRNNRSSVSTSGNRTEK